MPDWNQQSIEPSFDISFRCQLVPSRFVWPIVGNQSVVEMHDVRPEAGHQNGFRRSSRKWLSKLTSDCSQWRVFITIDLCVDYARRASWLVVPTDTFQVVVYPLESDLTGGCLVENVQSPRYAARRRSTLPNADELPLVERALVASANSHRRRTNHLREQCRLWIVSPTGGARGTTSNRVRCHLADK